MAILASATVSAAIIVPVTTALLPVVTIVPVSLGIVIVLSAVGSTAFIKISWSSCDDPSKTIPASVGPADV